MGGGSILDLGDCPHTVFVLLQLLANRGSGLVQFLNSSVQVLDCVQGESNVSDMPIEYTDVTKKYNKTICDDLGLTVPEGYEAIEG